MVCVRDEAWNVAASCWGEWVVEWPVKEPYSVKWGRPTTRSIVYHTYSEPSLGTSETWCPGCVPPVELAIRPATSKFGQILSSSRIWEKRGLKGELAPRAPVLPRFYRYGAQPETLENRYTGAARKRAQRGGERPCATAPGSQ